MDWINEYVLPHWPFFAFMIICAIAVQVAKATIWTLHNMKHRKPQWLYWWGRKTLPLHPAVVGALLGLIPSMPMSAPLDRGGEMLLGSLYYAFAGICSTFAFSVVKSLAKKRGIVLGLPQEVETEVEPTSKAEDITRKVHRDEPPPKIDFPDVGFDDKA